MSPVPSNEPSTWKKIFAPLLMVLAIGGKFLAKFKFLALPFLKYFPIILKTGGSMLLSIWVYAMFWGWKFAAGFVVLIFIHELGHVFAARWVKLDVSAPMFIPFVGAHILMKDMPPNARIEAIVGIGGPILGTVGALGCHVIYTQTGDAYWLALAYTGYFLNLFNLIPLTPLDGGRICAALSPWLWIPGLFGLIWLMFQRQSFNPVFFLILIAALPQVWRLFWSKTDEQRRYYTVSPAHRFIIALSYFGLAALLFYQKEEAMAALNAMGHWRSY